MKQAELHGSDASNGRGLLVNSTGHDADDKRSPGLASDLVPDITEWLRSAVG